jgi:predicted dehydrogenase
MSADHPISTPPSLSNLNRRRFLAGLGSLFAVPPLSSNGVNAASPNGKLHHACIGVGGMGWVDLQNFSQHPKVQVTALCDVDENHLKKAAELQPEARLYRDWRELLAREGDRLDSINVTVPDHMHYPIALTAIRAGKQVYCQKPLCHDVSEVRALTQAATHRNAVTQLGTHGASSVGERTAVHFLRSRTLGKIRHIYLCSNRPGAVEQYRLPGPRPAEGQAPPDSLHWDLWLGNAPVRPYAPTIYHPVKWRAWQDFGTGWSGDIGCHLFDAIWRGLGLEAPRSVIAEVQASWKASPKRRADTWPQGDHITWVFPGNSFTEREELVIEWFDGDYYPPKEIRALYSVQDYPPESAMVVGSEGALLIRHASAPILLPEGKFSGVPRPTLEPRNHYHHYVDACLGLNKTETDFGVSGPMTEAILLGTVAVRVPDTQLEWEPQHRRIPNSRAAERLLTRSYREGWDV